MLRRGSRRTTIAGTVLALACCLTIRPPRAADGAETRATDLFVRRPGTKPKDAIEYLAKEAKTRGVRDVIVAFDAISFSPPPHQNEFNGEWRYRKDLAAWLEALAEWKSRSGVAIWAATTLQRRAVEVGTPGWDHEVVSEAGRAWYDEPAFTEFEAADTWVTRFLVHRGWISDMPGPIQDRATPAMLVLVGGPLGPERWVPENPYDGPEAYGWRRMLRPVGSYWDEEKVAAQCRRASCSLFVVAPEARFGDHLPASESPDLPWVSRPVLPPRSSLSFTTAPTAPTTPVPDEVWEAVDRALGRKPKPRTTTGARLDRGTGSPFGRRFRSVTPFWYASFVSGDERLFHTDLPSGYGAWGLARAAAATGGRYVFYPFPPSDFLDVLPYDASLLGDLAPGYGPRTQWTAEHAGDRVMRALLEAEDLVVPRTPWADTWMQGRAAKGWGAFESVSPVTPTDGWRARRKPYDVVPGGDEKTIEAEGKRLAEVLPAYERAIEVLEEAHYAWKAGTLKGLPRRDHALLLAARFDYAMSAFHLHALSLYMREIERFRPPEFPKHVLEYYVTYVPTIRMSDVLEGYEKRILPDQGEVEFAPPPPSWPPRPDQLFRYQGNLLEIPESSPWYRAQRAPDRVLLELDARLVPDALRMIAAARDVMGSYARSPYGAVVYYSEAYTFVWKPVTGLKGNVGPAGKEKEKPPPAVTPNDPAPSEPGGPTTGGDCPGMPGKPPEPAGA